MQLPKTRLAHTMKALLLSILTAATVSVSPAADTTKAAAESINAFGLALHLRLAAEGGNVVASPWSIETALAMTYAGADGRTKAEMAKVLRFGAAEDSVHEGLRGIAVDLSLRAANSLGRVKRSKEQGGPSSPLEIQVANRPAAGLGGREHQGRHRGGGRPLERGHLVAAPIGPGPRAVPPGARVGAGPCGP